MVTVGPRQAVAGGSDTVEVLMPVQKFILYHESSQNPGAGVLDARNVSDAVPSAMPVMVDGGVMVAIVGDPVIQYPGIIDISNAGVPAHALPGTLIPMLGCTYTCCLPAQPVGIM